MPIEETGETRVNLIVYISMFAYAFKLKNEFQLEEEDIRILFS